MTFLVVLFNSRLFAAKYPSFTILLWIVITQITFSFYYTIILLQYMQVVFKGKGIETS